MVSAWVVRAGRYGERDSWAIEHGVSGGGWGEVPDLNFAQSRDDVAEVVAQVYGELSPGAQANYTGQLWALRGRISPGDILVMPMKTTRQIALGLVSRGYHYLGEQADPQCRHVVGVDWKITDLPRPAIKQDLLYTLGSAMSVFSPSKGAAVERLRAVLDHGADPGQLGVTATGGPESSESPDGGTETSEVDLLEVARDRVSIKISEEFVGHELSVLVTEILTAEGYTCTMSPPGPDHGIDIVAGRGLLGMESPRIVVQVKSGQVAESVVRDLLGVVHTQEADHGLLVAWGGLSGKSRDALRSQQFRVRAWGAEELVDAVLRTYERLPESIQTRIPLKRIWVLDE